MEIATKDDELVLIDAFRKLCAAAIDVKKSRGLIVAAAKWDHFFEASESKLKSYNGPRPRHDRKSAEAA